MGRGVKRKWSCLAELEVENLPPAADKEKDGEEDVDVEAEGGFLVAPAARPAMSHLQQRQLVLGLCLEKLQTYQAGVELSLRRSVLLINTLRQIQEDMQSDGAAAACTPESRLLRDEVREDAAVTCPSCSEDEGEDAASPPPPSPQLQEQAKLPAASTFSEAVSAMGYLSDLALDDIFEDIDTSMYESSELPAAWASGPLWPVSVSLWADEDVKRSAGHAAAGSLQSCLMDLTELDHIMEILVKS